MSILGPGKHLSCTPPRTSQQGSPPEAAPAESPCCLGPRSYTEAALPGCRAQRGLKEEGSGEVCMEAAALKLVFNEWGGPRAMEKRGDPQAELG